MSYNRPPNRSPFQQNSRSGNNQRSPQIKKYNSCPAWGSGAVLQHNGPSPGQFSSPGSFNVTSPPFNNGSTPSYNFTSPPQQQFRPVRNQIKSPRHHPGFRPNFNHGHQTFRTPQPMNRFPTSPQKSWSCDRNFRPSSKRLDLKVSIRRSMPSAHEL